MNCEALMNQDEHIQSILHKQSKQMRSDYRIHLTASIDCIRVLLRQGNSFRGHDETEGSLNPGNFLIQLEFLGAHNKEINDVILKNAPKNCKLTSPDIQKDIVRACATETINVIIKDIGNSLFSILVDESRDVLMKEQMSVVLRYVDSSGHINERFIGIEHVTNTIALSLKAAIDKMFTKYNLSISNVRGQGFDGASNMQALIAVAKKNLPISNFFRIVGDVVNVVGSSFKRSDLLKEKHSDFIVKALQRGEISSSRGLNQETTLQRAGDTRWGSHYNSLNSLISMFSAVSDVLEMISEDDSSSPDKKTEAFNLLESILSFDFVFNLHLMKHALGISSELSTALQKKDQDIVNAMDLVQVCKHRLQNMREDGWDSFLEKVHYFCQQHYIDYLKMDDMFTRWAPRGRPHRNPPEVTNLHHYRVDLFYGVIDMQLQELNDRFSKASTELLLCVACLCPQNSFIAFDKKKLLQLAKFYPQDFSRFDILVLDDQLETYICDMHSNKTFQGLKDLGDLSEKLVMSNKSMVYPLVFKLLTLALILPVATASVERVFSAMRIVKDRLRNRMSDDWMNDSLIVYVEKDIFLTVDNEAIIQKFQNMKTRKEQL
ncbi:zinc finger MYM-type protein 1-like [Zingiber officinale]|uniref:zinc finger MYM-type protein 1-like n=1 Tax=Zingiber officinale TaxID=94328 RepID=UPI001C4C1810|nr:zinc finger MYM-type protein 1-like [Zingiber officinale]